MRQLIQIWAFVFVLLAATAAYTQSNNTVTSPDATTSTITSTSGASQNNTGVVTLSPEEEGMRALPLKELLGKLKSEKDPDKLRSYCRVLGQRTPADDAEVKMLLDFAGDNRHSRRIKRFFKEPPQPLCAPENMHTIGRLASGAAYAEHINSGT